VRDHVLQHLDTVKALGALLELSKLVLLRDSWHILRLINKGSFVQLTHFHLSLYSRQCDSQIPNENAEETLK